MTKCVSHLKNCLDYCKDPSSSCDFLFFRPNRTILLTETKASIVSRGHQELLDGRLRGQIVTV